MTSKSHDGDPVARLLEVITTLRGDQGCSWDREQTHQSLIPFLIEEAYELIEAIETGSQKEIREELGDVLLQVVLHAAIAEESGHFSFREIVEKLTEKLTTRHPHVFGGQRLDTAEQVSQTWQQRKMETRQSALEGIPTGQPALCWASQVGSRAARTGFEWERQEDIFAKAREELGEFQRAVEARDGDGDGANDGAEEDAEMELGDLLFAVVQLARWRKIDPEKALRRSTRKFSFRFQHMESQLKDRNGNSEELNPDQWRDLWAKAKRAEMP